LVLAPKTDAISRATLGFSAIQTFIFPTDLKAQIRNLEIGIGMKFLWSYERGGAHYLSTTSLLVLAKVQRRKIFKDFFASLREKVNLLKEIAFTVVMYLED
jgi:hypothetical protein